MTWFHVSNRFRRIIQGMHYILTYLYYYKDFHPTLISIRARIMKWTGQSIIIPRYSEFWGYGLVHLFYCGESGKHFMVIFPHMSNLHQIWQSLYISATAKPCLECTVHKIWISQKVLQNVIRMVLVYFNVTYLSCQLLACFKEINIPMYSSQIALSIKWF